MSDSTDNSKLYLDTAELLALKETDYDAFIDRLYDTIIGYEEEALQDPEEADEKIEAIQVILEHYEKNEVYERCQTLYDLQKKIKG